MREIEVTHLARGHFQAPSLPPSRSPAEAGVPSCPISGPVSFPLHMLVCGHGTRGQRCLLTQLCPRAPLPPCPARPSAHTSPGLQLTPSRCTRLASASCPRSGPGAPALPWPHDAGHRQGGSPPLPPPGPSLLRWVGPLGFGMQGQGGSPGRMQLGLWRNRGPGTQRLCLGPDSSGSQAGHEHVQPI